MDREKVAAHKEALRADPQQVFGAAAEKDMMGYNNIIAESQDAKNDPPLSLAQQKHDGVPAWLKKFYVGIENSDDVEEKAAAVKTSVRTLQGMDRDLVEAH